MHVAYDGGHKLTYTDDQANRIRAAVSRVDRIAFDAGILRRMNESDAELMVRVGK